MTARTVEGAGVALAVQAPEPGAGPHVLIVHGIASDAAAWAPAADALAELARVAVYDRRGYGASTAPEPYGGTTVEEQAQDAVAVLDALGIADAIVLGDDFGSLVALDLMKRHAARVRAAVLAAPPAFAFVPDAAEALSAAHAVLAEALREGGPAAAVAAYLGDGANPDVVARAQVAHRAFFADYAGLATWPVTRRELRAMTQPCVLVTDPGSPAHVCAAADALAGVLPGARRERDGDAVAAARTLLA